MTLHLDDNTTSINTMKKSPLLLTSCLLFTMATAQSKIQNVVVIFSDDQGYEDLSSFGSKKADTPYIDQLAKRE